jgi:hypothetical protein
MIMPIRIDVTKRQDSYKDVRIKDFMVKMLIALQISNFGNTI